MAEQDPERVAGVREGQILDGKYRVERVLGIGGMGARVSLTGLRLDTRVAIESEDVARVLNVGTLEKGAPYKVTEDGPLSGSLSIASRIGSTSRRDVLCH